MLISVQKNKAQNEASQWYFGNFAGLNFITNPPSFLNNSMVNTNEGTASISDPNGSVLFYTDGVNVYNQLHQLMPNGCCLLGDVSATQAALIIKGVNNPNVYYIITQSQWVHYSIVDMSLANGLGDVTVKNILLNTNSTEKLAATKHCNGVDAWIVTHDLFSNVFRSYLLTATGINTLAVTSSIGSITDDAPGFLKISPNGKKIGMTSTNQTLVEIFDFNPSNGLVTNHIFLDSINAVFGCEFSGDGSKFYASELSNSIFQWDMCAGSNSQIKASKKIITNNAYAIGAMQLGPDGKIYLSRYFQNNVGVISNPNVSGPNANFQNIGPSLGSQFCLTGLPNFPSNYLQRPKTTPLPFTYQNNPLLSCKDMVFKLPLNLNTSCSSEDYFANSVYWEFGDPASGPANFSSSSNPTHTYSSFGTFQVKLIINYGCGADTIEQSVSVAGPTPVFSVAGPSLVCKGEMFYLTAAGAATYLWNSATTGSLYSSISSQSELVTVIGTNSSGSCSQLKTHTVTVAECLGKMDLNPIVNLSFGPNPADNFISFSKDLGIQTFAIYSCTGIEITSGTLSDNMTINVSGLANGMYLMEINEKPIRTKLIISH